MIDGCGNLGRRSLEKRQLKLGVDGGVCVRERERASEQSSKAVRRDRAIQ